MPGEIVDGTDVELVYESTLKAVERARNGCGPTLLECRTYRYKGHGIYMDPLAGRTKDELEEWMDKDPLNILEKKLLQDGLTNDELMKIDEGVNEKILDAVEFAKKSNYPTWNLMLKSFNN
jgi:pyruvate dehydrogenase E1 component alpha subunit